MDQTEILDRLELLVHRALQVLLVPLALLVAQVTRDSRDQ